LLLEINNPKANVSTAKNVYAMYTWISPFTCEPQADLIRILSDSAPSIPELIKQVQSKPDIKLHGQPATLYKIYIDNQNIGP
jgi:hypothetical protein